MNYTGLNIRRILAALALAFAGNVCVQAADPGWEHTAPGTTETTAAENIAANAQRVDVWTRDGFIYVNVNHKASVRVFTILGQTVSAQQLQPGTSRLRVPTRGIYLVRVDNSTRRVNV